MTPEAAQDLRAYFPDIFTDEDENEETKNESMKLTESKLRQIVREELVNEISGYKLSREYQKVANDAFERGSEDPKMALMHIRSILHTAEGVALELERSELEKRDVQELNSALVDSRIIAKELSEKVNDQ